MTTVPVAVTQRPQAPSSPPSPHPGAAEAPRKPTPRAEKSHTPPFVPKAVLAGVLPLVLLAAAGTRYYSLSMADRLRSPWHPWLGPTGWIGQSAGLLAFVLFAFLWLYPVRKRMPRAHYLGPLPRWLDAHIAAGVVMPFAGAVHAGFRFEGLIGLGYFSMMVVGLSGVVGRYLYVRIPRGRAGLELSRDQVSAERRDILAAIVESTGLDPKRILDLLQPVPAADGGNLLAILGRMFKDDLDRRRAIRRLQSEMRRSPAKIDSPKLKKVVQLARREMALAQQLRFLEATNKVFRMWHTFHLPFAIMAFVAVAVHVFVAVIFGVTWFR